MGKTYEVNAALPGRVLRIMVKPGDKVEDYQDVLVLEAMKMENLVSCEDAGIVKEISVSEGDAVQGGDVLMTIETDG